MVRSAANNNIVKKEIFGRLWKEAVVIFFSALLRHFYRGNEKDDDGSH